MKSFNRIPIPETIVARAAEDAAFAALGAWHRAERELALPVRARSLRDIHGEVIGTSRLAESLARETSYVR